MRQKYIINPFAYAGDITPAVPNAPDPNNYVSYSAGYTYDYQRNLITDSLAKSITRISMNAVLNDITTVLQALQQGGLPEFISSVNNNGTNFPYRQGSCILWSASGTPPFNAYISLVDENTSTPVVGGNQYWGLIANYVAHGMAAYGSGSYTFTVPVNVTQIKVKGWGAGGGGGGSGTGGAGTGGGGGGYFENWFSVTPSSAFSVLVGAGGAGGAAGGGTGVAGGPTTIGSFAAAGGGGGSGNGYGSPGTGATASGPGILLNGYTGGDFFTFSSYYGGGIGGNAGFSFAATSGSNVGAVGSSNPIGCGGNGAGNNSAFTESFAGGPGGSGFLIIEW